MTKIFKAIGLMSGTSCDGIDLALIESDGKSIINRKNFLYQKYDQEFRERLRSLVKGFPSLEAIKIVENELTILHAQMVNNFLAQNKINHSEIDLISFHGHTILHNPAQKITWQIGNSQLLEAMTKIKVISDLRLFDVAHGGQGAPLVPIYHFYLFKKLTRPCAVLNIGGISNITYLDDGDDENSIHAFDTCFGNAPLDDLVQKKLGLDFDQSGNLAKAGKIDYQMSQQVLRNEIFNRKPPKSFDRDDFVEILSLINQLKLEDALASFAFIHAVSLKNNLNFLPKRVKAIYVCGGGRKNLALLDEMKKQMMDIEIKAVEEVGFNGDSIEAEAFAFLAVRRVMNLPISFKNTTGFSG